MATVRKRTWTTTKGKERTAFVVDYFAPDPVTGKPKRRLETFKREKDAKTYLTKMSTEVAAGVHIPERESITLAEAAQIWIERGETEALERSTMRAYHSHLKNHIVPSKIYHEKLVRLTRPMIEAFRDDLLRRCTRVTAQKVLFTLKSILNEAMRRGLLLQNVAVPVKIKDNKRDRVKLEAGRDFPDKDEVNTIIDRAEPRWRPILVCAIFTGMRASELRGLAWGAVDFNENLIRVRQRADNWGTMGPPKSEHGTRTIPMAPIVVNTLKELKLACAKVGETDLVFPTSSGAPLDHSNLAHRGFYDLQRATGMVDQEGKPKYGVHSLRHFFASWAIKQEFSAKRLQALLGHNSIKMTFDIYGHLFPDLEGDHAKFAAGQIALVGP
jgi:integrase